MDVSGDFETHLTVRLENGSSLRRLAEWAGEHGLKCLHIVLDSGVNASQPMLTKRLSGNLTTVKAESSSLCESLEAAGFLVRRIKIEASVNALGVPQTDAEVRPGPPSCYFEHHVKLLLPVSETYPFLTELVAKHTARLSRNALRSRPGGFIERFATQRCYAVGQLTARQQLTALLQDLRQYDLEIRSIDEEFVVYDSQPGLDDGWLQQGE